MADQANSSTFESVGKHTDVIDVRLSYKIVELFSEQFYSSPSKALEELVANSFDAGAANVYISLPSNLQAQDARILVIDDGSGMDVAGLKQHWLIGLSNKRRLDQLPKNRHQIGKFGIGKLATYVLANQLTHVSKHKGKYYATSMDYTSIDRRVESEVEPKSPIKLPVREFSETDAKKFLESQIPHGTKQALKAANKDLFGRLSSESWTVTILSRLKSRVSEVKPGQLEWILRTALPLRPDFNIWLNDKKLESSKYKGLKKRWVLGKDLTEPPRPSSKGITVTEDKTLEPNDDLRYGLDIPDLGVISGYAEAYKELLTTGKSNEVGRSHGFFVYVLGRLINVSDGHFGIPPNELRHGTFGRFRLVVHMDGLDEDLRSNRETVSEGPRLTAAQNTLRAIFNHVRTYLERQDDEEEPGTRLARRLAATPASLSRLPIVNLARQIADNKVVSRYLSVPPLETPENKRDFLSQLEQRAGATDDRFVTGLTIDYGGQAADGLAQYDTASGHLRINAWHPFVAAFYDEFVSKGASQPLELLAMAEVLAEAHLYEVGVKSEQIYEFLNSRDALLRALANESGRKSALSVANDLREARNDASGLEEQLCAAFRSLGFDVIPIGGNGKPDGVATALLAADSEGRPRQYSVSLEAKSKEQDKGTVKAGTVKVSAVVRQRDDFKCQHALVLGRAFPTSKGDESALAREIADDRAKTKAAGEPKTITLITIDDLAELVRLRPLKQLGLQKLRQLFQNCSLPKESHDWIVSLSKEKVKKPPYRRVIETIELLQRKFRKASVKYSALRVALSMSDPPIEFETDDELADLCRAMAQMAPSSMAASADSVELDQSSRNVVAAIEAATKDLLASEE